MSDLPLVSKKNYIKVGSLFALFLKFELELLLDDLRECFFSRFVRQVLSKCIVVDVKINAFSVTEHLVEIFLIGFYNNS